MPPKARQDGTRTIGVTLILRTNDRRVFPENIDVSTVLASVRSRLAIIENLDRVERVVCVMDEELALVMHSAAQATELRGIRGESMVSLPSPSYRPPGPTMASPWYPPEREP